MRALATLGACVALAGCGVLGGASLPASGPGILAPGAPSPPAAQATVRIGSSTKADITAALGPANVIAFDTGWEVWVYRWPGVQRSTRSATELVILFEPAGVVRKVRVRPGVA